MKKFLFFISLAVLFTACESQVDIEPVNLDFETPDIIASLPDQTRTFLGEGNTIYWNVGDQLTVFSKSDHNLKYQIAELEEGSTTARFTYTREYVLHSGTKFQRYVAAFPFDEATTVDPSNGVISMMLPSTQFYDAARDFRYVPLTAVSTSMNMNFVAPSSVLRLRVNKDNPNEIILKRVIVESASQYIAGMVDINMMDSTPVAVVNESLDIPSKSIVLDFGSGVELTDELQQFYIALPVTNFGVNDLKITCVYDMNGDEFKASKTYDKEVNFKVASIKSTNITITNPDVNGSTVDGDLVVGGNMELDEPLVVPSGEVTITVDGKLTNSASNPNSALIVVGDDATLTIDGSGSIETLVPEAQATALSATRATFNSAFPIVVNGTLRIKGGSFSLNSYATSWLNCGIYIGPNGKLIVEDGTFRSPKGSFIFGHELGNRPTIEIVGGRFEGYDPSDNDFDGNGSNYLEPEYASYYVAENELVVAERTAEWKVDNNYLLKSIIENGGTAHLVVPEEGYYELTESMSVNYPVTLDISNSADAKCCIYFDGNDTMFRCYSDLTIGSPITFGQIDSSYEMPKEPLFYLEAVSDIATVYEGGSLTVNNGEYFGGTDGVTTSLFNSRGGDITINNGAFSLDIIESNTITVEGDGQVVIYDGDFYNNFDPANVDVNGEIKSLVAPERYSVALLKGGYGVKQKGTFTAASYNVDGLPNIQVNLLITKIQLNPDGPLEDGTNSISQKLAADAWDIIAFQEDFNFHDNLISSMEDIYTFGKHRGTVGAAQVVSQADTDGLGFATLNSTSSFANQTFVEFTDKYGGLTSGANDCIKKGFRYYTVTLKGGAEIDVYVTHMNSGSDSGHISARQSQFKQLAEYIVAHDNGRPVLILGDFNARYTRDDFGTYFWANLGDKVNYFNDAWVELVDKYDINGNLLYAAGEYPEYGTYSLVVTEKYSSDNTVNDIHCTTQGGEVVDKILYINNPNSDVAIFANSFERDMDYTEADHAPVVSEFTYYY